MISSLLLVPQTAHIGWCEVELNDAVPAEIAIQSFPPTMCSSAYHEKTTFTVGGSGYEENDTEIAFSFSVVSTLSYCRI